MKLPKHLAIILDGNRRWSDKHGIARKDAIYYGIGKVEEILFDWSEKFEKEYKTKPFEQLTIYALTANNVLKRPKEEIDEIYNAFLQEIFKIKRNSKLHERKVQVKFGGSHWLIPEDLKDAMNDLMKLTEDYDGCTFFIPLAYDGNMEILDAFETAKAKHPSPSKEDFLECLYFPDALPIDMMIRTGGEQRLSKFMLWYIGEAELFFINEYPEDFTYEQFIELLEQYGKRDRRFGK